MDETVHLVSRWAVLGRLAFDATPRSVLQLAEGVISSMIWNSMKFAASGTVLAVGILSTVVVGQQARVTEKIPGKGQSTSAISKGAESAKAQPPLEGSLNRRHSADEIKLRNQQIRERLYTKVDLGLYDLAPFTEFLKAIRRVSAKNSDLGVPIYVDPIGMQEVNQPADVMAPTHGERGGTIEDRLSVALRSLGLAYVIRDGFVWVNSRQSIVESRLSQVEEKLDRILELLEKERR